MKALSASLDTPMFSGPTHEQSLGEEIANSVSHGLALVAMLFWTACHYFAVYWYAA